MNSDKTWKFHYALMRTVPLRLFQRGYWWFLRKTGGADRMCDEGFWKCKMLANNGEIFASPEKGGGINSCFVEQALHWKSDIPAIGCDKWAVRQYVREKYGDDILTPLLGAGGKDHYWTNPDDIDFASLPNKFVFKCNNGSEWNIVVTDKAMLDVEKAKETMRSWMNSQYGSGHRENQYSKMSNKILCEEFIETPGEKVPTDYKIFCSDGKPLALQVETGRFTKDYCRTIFSTEWEWQDVYTGVPRRDKGELSKPKNFEKMLDVAAKLSKGIPMVRVDLYNVQGKIIFGELTFTSFGFSLRYTPFSWSQSIAKQTRIKFQ